MEYLNNADAEESYASYYEDYERNQSDPQREEEIERCVYYIDKIKEKIEKLQAQKESLENIIKSELRHNQEGARTYETKNYKITVTTNKNYTVDKEKYKKVSGNFKYNPIKEKISYTVSSTDYHKYYLRAPKDERKIIDDCIKISDAKLSVKTTKINY